MLSKLALLFESQKALKLKGQLLLLMLASFLSLIAGLGQGSEVAKETD